MMKLTWYLTVVLILGALGHMCCADEVTPAKTELDLNNPHKGFMLWGTDYANGAASNFHGSSIYHIYVPWREIEISDEVFDWNRFERNHLLPVLKDHPEATFVLRPIADYPDGSNSGITGFYAGGETRRDYPKFLEQEPLNIAHTDYQSCDGDGPGRTPDWNDKKMIDQLAQFVAAFGKQYDGDPRITCIQTGLLGLWGEWHQSGCGNLGPETAVKEAVRDAYARSFKRTRVQTRYPRKPDAVGVEFGFFEDFFPSFTAPCKYGFPKCSDDGDWNMHWCFENLTPKSKDNWISSPISGESPLKVQKKTWTDDTDDILTVIRDYHFSILGPAGAHEWKSDSATMARIKRMLGYNYHIDSFRWPDKIVAGKPFEVTLVISNSGSAPCYHPMPIELALCTRDDAAAWKGRFTFDLRKAIPGKPISVTEQFTVEGVGSDSYSIRLGILNPRLKHKPGVLIQSAGRDPNNRYRLGKVDVTN